MEHEYPDLHSEILIKTEEFSADVLNAECGDKELSRKQHLESDEVISTAVKFFKCQFCDVAFHQKINLQHHKQTHTYWRTAVSMSIL